MISKKFKWLAAGSFFLFAGITALMFWLGVAPGTLRPKEPPKRHLDAFSFMRSDGKNVTEKDLKGSYVVIDFIFTRCTMSCPIMSAQMKRLQEEFHSKKNLKLFSISVDPSDSSNDLRAYAKKFEADPAMWFFATGEGEKVETFATKTLTVSANDEPSLHSTLFVLVSDQGEILGHYNSADVEAMTKLYDVLGRQLGA